MIRFVFALFFFSACSSDASFEDEIPKNIIPQDSMVSVLYEMSILEAHINQKYIQLEKYAKLLRMSGDSLLVSKGYSRAKYEESVRFYALHAELYLQIHDSVLSRLHAGKVQEMQSNQLDRMRNYQR